MYRFEDVDLEPEQKDLLVTIVEAYRQSRDEFMLIKQEGTAGEPKGST